MHRWLFLLLFLWIGGLGCLGVGSSQPPDILPAGERTVGLGIPFMIVGTQGSLFGILFPEVYGRVGLGHRLDLGWQFPLFLFGGDGFVLNLGGDLRFSPVAFTNKSRPLLILRENLWMTDNGYLSLTLPMIGLGVQHTFVGAGPILYRSSDNGKPFLGMMGYRVEWTSERPISWGILRPGVALTLLTRSPDGEKADLWVMSAGASVEIALGRRGAKDRNR